MEGTKKNCCESRGEEEILLIKELEKLFSGTKRVKDVEMTLKQTEKRVGDTGE